VSDRDRVVEASERLADAIARRDVEAIGKLLAPGFVHRTPGGDSVDAAAFLAAIPQIPGEIEFVRLEALQVDLHGDGAFVTGIQHARVRIDGRHVDDRRAFVDWFVRVDGAWRLRAAAELPGADGA